MKHEQNCGNCVWGEVNAHGQKECRRRSPIALPTQKQGSIHGQVQMAIVTLWPPVAAELRCGEHEPIHPVMDIKG